MGRVSHMEGAGGNSILTPPPPLMTLPDQERGGGRCFSSIAHMGCLVANGGGGSKTNFLAPWWKIWAYVFTFTKNCFQVQSTVLKYNMYWLFPNFFYIASSLKKIFIKCFTKKLPFWRVYDAKSFFHQPSPHPVHLNAILHLYITFKTVPQDLGKV